MAVTMVVLMSIWFRSWYSCQLLVYVCMGWPVALKPRKQNYL